MASIPSSYDYGPQMILIFLGVLRLCAIMGRTWHFKQTYNSCLNFVPNYMNLTGKDM
jgi:hypothetical protein